MWELGWWKGWRSLMPAVTLTLLCSPLYLQVWLGNFGNLLALLFTVAWVADRHDRQWLAGVAIGLAAGVKLFPAYEVTFLNFSNAALLP